MALTVSHRPYHKGLSLLVPLVPRLSHRIQSNLEIICIVGSVPRRAPCLRRFKAILARYHLLRIFRIQFSDFVRAVISLWVMVHRRVDFW